MLADYVKEKWGKDPLTVVSPDSGRVRVADIWADRLGAPLAIIHKRRDPNVPNKVSVHELVGEVEGRTCVLVDDMIDTGGTIVAAAQALKANGAKRVIVAATHAVFSEQAVQRLSDDAIDNVIVTNTLPIPPEKEFAKLTVLSIAPLISKAIRAVFGEDSVTSLFPGQS
jgi:ribose-phosphate pyrophosphokinase